MNWLKKGLFYGWALLLLLGAAMMSCTSNVIELPNTPESVARQWQEWVDNNQYLKARKLSTGNAIKWIDWLEETLQQNALEEDTLPPARFLSMSCTERDQQASCVYLIDDDGYQYRDSFFLQKINGQWLVDIPEQDLIEDDAIEELFREMERLDSQQIQ